MKLVTDLLQQDMVTDAELLDCAYGIKYYTFDTVPTAIEAKRMRQMRGRLMRLEKEQRAAALAKLDQPREIKADCGHYTSQPMSASLGTSCPYCYDRMSN